MNLTDRITTTTMHHICDFCQRSIKVGDEIIVRNNSYFHKKCFVAEFLLNKLTEIKVGLDSNKITEKDAISNLIEINAEIIRHCLKGE